MVDAKATRMMSYALPDLSSDTEPFCFFASLNKESLPFSSRCVSQSNSNILDFFTEVIIISGWSNRIPTQSINIRVPESWSVDYLEVKIL
jgi:hypothetical protein